MSHAVVLVLIMLAQSAVEANNVEFETPIRVVAAGKPIDTDIGHACAICRRLRRRRCE